MSAVTTNAGAVSGPRSRLEAYRDDGPLARLLGRTLGSAVPLPALVLTLVAPAPLIVAFAIGDGGDPPRVALGAAVGCFVLVAGTARGRPYTGRFVWAVPPLLRLLEYGTLLAFAVLAGSRAVPACFALGAALAFHHYDVVYRLRHQATPPLAWVSNAGGGWDGRLLVAYALLLTATLGTGYLVAAVVLGALYVTETTVGWLRLTQAQRPALYADEEDEDD